MRAEVFCDSNILLYSSSTAPEDAVKRAEALGARELYSEDLNDGQAYGSVRVVNPFK